MTSIPQEYQKYLDEFLDAMNKKTPMEHGSRLLRFSCWLTEQAQKITAQINTGFVEQKELRNLFGQLTGQKPDKNFKLYPPFYTDCGKNIHLGKRVFINSCCCFQDQGGIFIGDDVQIGHGVKILTLNHGRTPAQRTTLYPEPVYIEENVWIGSGAIILPGVRVGKDAIVGAGSVVTKDVAPATTVAGNPARPVLHKGSENCN